MKYVYPILLTPCESGYVVYVPDFDINTEGASLSDAIDMARDAIGACGLSLQDLKKEIPQPSTIVLDHKEGEIATLVDIDFDAYRRANDLRTIRKNVTLPSWLAYEAEREGVNFSQVLQEGLKAKLNL